MKMTWRLERLQIIYDLDHGAENYGWYVRIHEASTLNRTGSQLDEPVAMDIPAEPSRRQESALRGEARRVARREGYAVPNSFPVEVQ